MKRLTFILLSLLLTLALCACGGAEEPVQEEPQEGGLIQKITLGLVAVSVILQLLSIFHILG